jgi:hypothetical protein
MRRFKLPWTAERTPGGYVVKDATGYPSSVKASSSPTARAGPWCLSARLRIRARIRCALRVRCPASSRCWASELQQVRQLYGSLSTLGKVVRALPSSRPVSATDRPHRSLAQISAQTRVPVVQTDGRIVLGPAPGDERIQFCHESAPQPCLGAALQIFADHLVIALRFAIASAFPPFRAPKDDAMPATK